MICFMDRTFCPFGDCALSATCSTYLSDGVKAGAKAWWGGDDAPIAVFVDKPECWAEAE